MIDQIKKNGVLHDVNDRRIPDAPNDGKTYVLKYKDGAYEWIEEGEQPIPETYTITANVTNGSASGDETIDENGTAEVVVGADADYALPDEINVTNATYSYDKNTGVITLSEPSGDVVITVVCEAVQPSVTLTPFALNDVVSSIEFTDDTSKINEILEEKLDGVSTLSVLLANAFGGSDVPVVGINKNNDVFNITIAGVTIYTSVDGFLENPNIPSPYDQMLSWDYATRTIRMIGAKMTVTSLDDACNGEIFGKIEQYEPFAVGDSFTAGDKIIFDTNKTAEEMQGFFDSLNYVQLEEDTEIALIMDAIFDGASEAGALMVVNKLLQGGIANYYSLYVVNKAGGSGTIVFDTSNGWQNLTDDELEFTGVTSVAVQTVVETTPPKANGIIFGVGE